MPVQLDLISMVLIATVVLLLLILIWLVKRRRSLSVEQQLKRVSLGVISNVLIDDGEGGEIHLEHIILLPQEMLLLDIRDLTGNVFGSDAMQDWTVIDGSRRFTFTNPQHALYDRLAALRSLLPNASVRGLIAFTARCKVAKGTPSDVIEFDALLSDMAKATAEGPDTTSLLLDSWEKLRNAAVVAQVERLMEE